MDPTNPPSSGTSDANADADDLPPLGEALATLEPELIYYEAKRQYEALSHSSAPQPNNSHAPNSNRHTPRITRQHTDLSLHYRTLFERSTKYLDDLQKQRLLHICFAYKTKEGVLGYLELLDAGKVEWVVGFRSLVGRCGRDSVFEQAVERGVDGGTGDGKGREYDEEQEAHRDLGRDPLEAFRAQAVANRAQVQSATPTPVVSVYGLRSSSRITTATETGMGVAAALRAQTATATTTKHQGPYFVVPALPLAYPSEFFTALASQAPLSRLASTSTFLLYPSIYLLPLNSTLKTLLRANFPDFWKPPLPATREQGRAFAQEKETWRQFFEHLLKGQATLVMPNGARLPIDEPDGYGRADLEMWRAGWVADRQMRGLRERGQEERVRIRVGLGDGQRQAEERDEKEEEADGVGQSVVQDEDDDESMDQDGDGDIEQQQQVNEKEGEHRQDELEDGKTVDEQQSRAKKVSFHITELEQVCQIPARVIPRKRKRRNW